MSNVVTLEGRAGIKYVRKDIRKFIKKAKEPLENAYIAAAQTGQFRIMTELNTAMTAVDKVLNKFLKNIP